MHLYRRPLSKHQRARLIAWTLAMLAWLAQVLFAGSPFTPRHERQRARRMSIERLTHQVKMLILYRAMELLPLRRRRVRFFRGRSLAPRGLVSAALGGRVRRMLRRKQIGERIAALIYALIHIDAYAGLVAKRLRRGLTRRFLALFAIDWPRSTPGGRRPLLRRASPTAPNLAPPAHRPADWHRTVRRAKPTSPRAPARV